MEKLAVIRAAGWRGDAFQDLSCRLLEKMRALRTSQEHERLVYSERELEGIVRLRDSRAVKAQRMQEARLARQAERRARLAEREHLKEAHRAAKVANDALKKERRRLEREQARAQQSEAKVP